MPVISGDLRLVTDRLDTVTSVSVRARETRAQGSGLVLGYNAPVPVDNGRVEFDALPGPAVLVLAHGGMATEAVPLLVPDVGAVSLADAARAATLADDATLGELEHLAAQAVADVTEVRRLRGEVREDTATATDAAGRAAGSATSAGNAAINAGNSEDRAGQSAATAGQKAADAATSATAAAGSATTAGQKAAAAGTSATAAAGSATTAGTKAQEAAGSASTASTRAGEAATSAAAAAASEKKAAETAAAGVADATPTTKGKIRLAGDIAGTADAPTVPGLAGKADKQATDAALAGKVNTGHKHVKADVTDLPAVTTTATGNALVQRTSAGQVTVPATPSATTDAGSKSYVDAQDATVLAKVQARPALYSGAGTPPASIPGAVVGDSWLDTTTMQLYEITGV